MSEYTPDKHRTIAHIHSSKYIDLGEDSNLYISQAAFDRVVNGMALTDFLNIVKEIKANDNRIKAEKRKGYIEKKALAEAREKYRVDRRKRLLSVYKQAPEELTNFVTEIYSPHFAKYPDSNTKFFDYIDVVVTIMFAGEFGKQRELVKKYARYINSAVMQSIAEHDKFKESGIGINFLSMSAVLTRDSRIVYKISIKNTDKLYQELEA